MKSLFWIAWNQIENTVALEQIKFKIHNISLGNHIVFSTANDVCHVIENVITATVATSIIFQTKYILYILWHGLLKNITQSF